MSTKPWFKLAGQLTQLARLAVQAKVIHKSLDTAQQLGAQGVDIKYDNFQVKTEPVPQKGLRAWLESLFK